MDEPGQVELGEASLIGARALPLLLLVGEDFRIIDRPSRTIDAKLVDPDTGYLCPALHRIVRDVLKRPSPPLLGMRVMLPPRYAITVSGIFGLHSGPIAAVMIEETRVRENLATAKASFSLTARETEILELMLDGASTSDVARVLHLAETTVQGYFKRLLSKTASRNRAAMIAKVLGWRARREFQET